MALACAWPLTAGSKLPVSNRQRLSGSAQVGSVTGEGRGVEPLESVSTVKLNYLRAPWQRVLEDLADSMGLELVADDLPSDKFSRIDPRAHKTDMAVKILNRELEARGYRLLVKKNHLVVMQLNATRRDYVPAVIQSDNRQPNDAPGSDVQRTGAEVEPARSMQVKSLRSRDDAQRRPASRAGAPAEPIRRVQAYEDEELPRLDEPPVAETIQSTVRLKFRDARAITKVIERAFRTQAERIEDGPGGLDGLRVYAAGPADPGQAGILAKRRVRFTLGIDDERNALVVEAARAETESVLKLVQALDVKPKEAGETVRAVPTTKDSGRLARSLQSQLDRLVMAARMQTLQERSQREDEEAARPARPQRRRPADRDAEAEDQPARPRAGDDERTGVASLLGGGLQGTLKGEVTIEAVPELSIFIIRGNEEDVATVMAIIREIEKLSEGLAPTVELALLQHVASDALAPLLTSIYERISPSRAGRPATTGAASNVVIFAIARPNALLIVAPKDDIDSIRELIDDLDQPSDPKSEYRVFRLRSAIPSQVVDTIRELYPVGQTAAPGAAAGAQAAGTNDLSPRVRIVADPRANAVIVQARPRDMREVALLIRDLDTHESAAVKKLRIFPLNNATADEMTNTLLQAIQGAINPARLPTTTGAGNQFGGANQFGGLQGGFGQGGASAQELRDVQSSILEFIDAEGPDGRELRTGILSDIRVTSDPRTNSVVVTAPPESMELVAALINKLDQPTPAVAEIKVFSLANADATTMVTLIERLFGIQATAQRLGQQGQFGQNLQALVVAGAEDASSTLIPLRFSVDVRTNSIIAVGGAEALRVVEAVLYRLDESDIQQRKNTVYPLKNTPAAEVANSIQLFLTSRRQIEQADPGLVSPFEQFEREVVVVPETVGNKLLISATPRYFKDIIELVKQLDQVPRQVVISALLVEVELSTTDEWGLEVGVQDSILFDRSLITQLVNLTTTTTNLGVQTTTQNLISQSSTPGFNFNSAQLGNNTTPSLDTGRIGTQGLSNFNVGRVNSDLGYGGLVLSAGSESLSVLLRALAARRRVDVLSRPQVTALDNQIAQIQVGQEIPRITSFSINQTTGFATPIPTPRAVGIILQVAPRVTPDDTVVMEVAARKDGLNPQGVPLFVNPDGSTVTSPIIDTTNAQTSVIVRSGQTIVLGGMITSNDATDERKVPLLGDLPLVGQLFRYDSKRSRRSELLIFLTPRIVHNDEEAELIKEIEAQRLNFIEAEAELMHGPLFGVPAPLQSPGDPALLPAAPSGGQPDGSMPNEGRVLPRGSAVRPVAATQDDDENVPTTYVDQDAALALQPTDPPRPSKSVPPKTSRKSPGLFKRNR